MQRQPYTFIMAQEYDRLLPPHWLVEPAAGKPQAVLGENPAAELSVGEIVRIGDFPGRLLRPDGISWALRGKPVAGQAPLRIRWLRAEPPCAGELGRITAGRLDLLARWTAGFERFDLPDPLETLPALLKTTLSGHPLYHSRRPEPGEHPGGTRQPGLADRLRPDARVTPCSTLPTCRWRLPPTSLPRSAQSLANFTIASQRGMSC